MSTTTHTAGPYTFYRTFTDGRTGWRRYTTAKGIDWDRSWALGKDDMSPRAAGYMATGGAKYDGERCSCCYLNIAHTTALHNDRVRDYTQSLLAFAKIVHAP